MVDIPRQIRDHAAIGDLHTLALVATDGAIDFMCWPSFDSPSIFAALLDPERGGVFELSPRIEDARVVQMYLPDTNVVLTEWLGELASAEVLDFMPVLDADSSLRTRLVRRVRVTRGEVEIRLRCAPRFDYARQRVQATLSGESAWFRPGSGPGPTLRLCGPGLRIDDGDVVASFMLRKGECAEFVLDDGIDEPLGSAAIIALRHETIQYWQHWAAQSNYKGRWREVVTRSALTLKLLTSRLHGSIVAAGTFGLPEASGGVRNWDYRATWIRDASFSVYALMRLGYRDEARAFNLWVTERARQSGARGQLQIMYTVDGSSDLEERSLPHLRGYGGAQPVRIGNAAHGQLQLDIYGELLDSIYLSNKYGDAISHDNWLGVCHVVDHVCESWHLPDAGIWEMRSEPREYLHSRLMCWVAVDRAVRLALKRSLVAPLRRWIATRDAIYNDIWNNFWNPDLGHFVQSKGGTRLDAALLMMPLVRFVSATDPRWLATLDAIGEQLYDEGVVYRYIGDDGLHGTEGAFSACSFWYAECQARAGRLRDARFIFEKVLQHANHVDLYAEQFSVRGDLLGNFPQAFTHLALISAAYYIDRELQHPAGELWRA